MIAILLSLVSLLAPELVPAASRYDALKQQAEAAYAEKSFSVAARLYAQVDVSALSDDERRWVEMRRADIAWRVDSAAPADDDSVRNDARAALEEIVRKNATARDRVWAEAEESLGDFYAFHPRVMNPYQSRQHWTNALDWWAGSADLALARRRYIDIAWRMASAYSRYQGAEFQPGSVPRDVLLNILQIADKDADRDRARFYLASQYLSEQSPASVERGLQLLDQLIADGRKTGYLDDALFLYASQLAGRGNVVVTAAGELAWQQDFRKALELYRRITSTFKESESNRYGAAVAAIKSITDPSLTVMISQTFLPESEQEVVLSTRNVKSVEFQIVPVDLTTDLLPKSDSSWLQRVRGKGAPIRRWTVETGDGGEHVPMTDRVRLTPKLPPGAYDVIASGGGEVQHQLLLVSDTHLLVHAAGGRMDVYVSNVNSGEPVGGARVAVQWQNGNKPDVVRTVTAGSNGLARIDVPDGITSEAIITAAAGASRQAFHTMWTGGSSSEAGAAWRVYAFTDRPAYRPAETVQWKIIARTRRDGSGPWTIPSPRTLHYQISNPRGEKVVEGTAKLNEFGSFWGELPLTADMPLGEYTIGFRPERPNADDGEYGSAQLFRLEEYKLPEFRVDVSTPKGKQYRLGETIEAGIDASYYFGGPVANASVEVVVREEPFYRDPYPWRRYGWLYGDDERSDRYVYGGGGQIVKRETLRTDANGRAIVRIETNRDRQDTSYTIEARVIDASRREVRGEGTVRAMRHRYSVNAWAEHYLHRPNEKVSINIKAATADDQPIQTTGNVKVLRRTWQEIWIDPAGHEVTGSALATARKTSPVFPPPVRPGTPPWRLRKAVYTDEEILTAKISTDAKGEAVYTFTPPREGYYVVQWSSEDRDAGAPLRVSDLVTAETAVWVTKGDTMDLGYHAADLEIVLDKDAFRNGQTAPVMLVTQSSGRWVLLTTSADGIIDTQVVHLDGSVKLLQLPIDARHVPNFFITASSVYGRALSTDTKRVVVPPDDQFLDVSVTADRAEYEPRQEGRVTITTRDLSGKPVPAEVALAVSDESVTAIQQDTAGDPRLFFYADTREQAVNVGASVQSQQYVVLVEYDGRLLDERQAKEEREEAAQRRDRGVGAANAEYAQESMAMAPPPPAAAPIPTAGSGVAAEAITVSASSPRVQAKAAMVGNVAGSAADAAGGIQVQVRSDFRSTAFWKPDIVTDANGTATVAVKFPEALTTWRATARAVTASTQVGMGSSTVRTNLPLVVRLQAPRFFVTGDRAVVSAVINNNTNAAVRVTPALEMEGLTLAGGESREMEIAANGDARADWTVVAQKAGPAKLRVSGRTTAAGGDAMERTFTVYEHGIDKLVARSGKVRGGDGLVKLDLPHERRATELVVQVTPSLAVTMLDALPYLIDFPYGCTEQTMSRFLPAAIVARTLASQGLSRADVEARMFGGIANPANAKSPRRLGALDEVTSQSIARLYDMQHGDGGWGWWKEGESDLFMTGYVVWGFAIAREGGLPVDNDRVSRGARWLENNVVRAENDHENAAWILHALAAWRHASGSSLSTAERKAFDNVFANRERLSAYSRALLALAANDYGDTERAKVLVRNLEDGVTIDRTPDQSVLISGTSSTNETMATAHWGASRFWWNWWEGPVETTAFVLQALVRIEPNHRLIEPTMNWLVKNRRGAQWNNTRDTAISLLALNDYLKSERRALGNGIAYELTVNGKVIATKTLTAADVLAAPSRFVVDESLVRDANEIRIRRTSGDADAVLYFAAEARFVSLEEPVRAAGNELFVRRDYLRLAPKPTLLKGTVYEKVPLRDGQSIVSGDRVEVVVTVETKNDYDYLLFEDLKPAGLEAVELQSGTPLYAQQLRAATVTRKLGAGEDPTVVRRGRTADVTPRSTWVYQELRDRKVALFIDHLPQGIWEIRYTMRAEVPGSFHALPLLGQAMYVPEIRANGEEVRMEVTEAPAPQP